MINIVRIEKNDKCLSIFVNYSLPCNIRWQSNKGHIVYPENNIKILDLIKINFDISKFKHTEYELISDNPYIINISEENRLRNQKYFNLKENCLLYLNLSLQKNLNFKLIKFLILKIKSLELELK